jgi:hypothetical protein
MPEQTPSQPAKKFKPQALAAWMPPLTVLLAVAYAVAFYFLLILPKIGPLMSGGKYDVAPLKERAQSEQDYIDKMGKTLSAFKSVDAAQTDKVESAMPSSADFPSLVDAMNDLADRHDMTLSTLDSVVDEKAVGRFGRGQILLTATFSNGSYSQLRALLPDMERSMRLLDIDSLSFVGENQYNFKIQSYFVDLDAE